MKSWAIGFILAGIFFTLSSLGLLLSNEKSDSINVWIWNIAFSLFPVLYGAMLLRQATYEDDQAH